MGIYKVFFIISEEVSINKEFIKKAKGSVDRDYVCFAAWTTYSFSTHKHKQMHKKWHVTSSWNGKLILLQENFINVMIIKTSSALFKKFLKQRERIERKQVITCKWPVKHMHIKYHHIYQFWLQCHHNILSLSSVYLYEFVTDIFFLAYFVFNEYFLFI